MGFYKRKDNGDYEVNSPYSKGTETLESKTLPNGEKPKPFKEFEVKLLRDIDEGYEEGDVYKVQMTPACEWYLMDGMSCFKMGAEEGEDFEFVSFS